MALRRRIGNFWYKFRIGYSVYLLFPSGFISLIVTLYFLAMPYFINLFPWLAIIFPNFGQFAVISLFIMLPLGYEFGNLHFSKRSKLYRQEAVMSTLRNPYNRDLLVPVWVPAWEALSEVSRAVGQVCRSINLDEAADRLSLVADKIDETLKRSKGAYAQDGFNE